MTGLQRRLMFGLVAGLLASVVLAVSLGAPWLGGILGSVLGSVYALAFHTTPCAYANSVLSAMALGVPLWAVVSVIVPLLLDGLPLQYCANARSFGERRACSSCAS